MLNKEEIKELAEKYAKEQGTHDKPEITAHDFSEGYTHCQQTELPEVAIGFYRWGFKNDWHPADVLTDQFFNPRTGEHKAAADLFKQYLEWLEKQKENNDQKRP